MQDQGTLSYVYATNLLVCSILIDYQAIIAFLSSPFTLYSMTYQDYHLQLLWVSAVVHCNRGKSFIFWLLGTTEVGTIPEAGRLWSVVWRYILVF